MENIIEIRGDRVIVEKNGQYFEKKIKTIEDQIEEEKMYYQIKEQLNK